MPYDEFIEMYKFKGPKDSSSGPGWTPLRYACLHDGGSGMGSVIKRLLGAGADVEAPLAKAFPKLSHVAGQTILQSAAMLSKPEVVKILLTAGANRGQIDALGGNSVHVSLERS